MGQIKYTLKAFAFCTVYATTALANSLIDTDSACPIESKRCAILSLTNEDEFLRIQGLKTLSQKSHSSLSIGMASLLLNILKDQEAGNDERADALKLLLDTQNVREKALQIASKIIATDNNYAWALEVLSKSQATTPGLLRIVESKLINDVLESSQESALIGYLSTQHYQQKYSAKLVQTLIGIADNPYKNIETRRNAIYALGKIAPLTDKAQAVAGLVNLLQRPEIALESIQTLVVLGKGVPSAQRAIVKILSESSPENIQDKMRWNITQAAGLKALAYFDVNNEEFRKFALTALLSKNTELQVAAVQALGTEKIADAVSDSRLLSIIKSTNAKTRLKREVALALARRDSLPSTYQEYLFEIIANQTASEMQRTSALYYLAKQDNFRNSWCAKIRDAYAQSPRNESESLTAVVVTQSCS